MTCRVIPAVRLPRGLDAFDYSVPDIYQERVDIGVYCIIPFRGKKCVGLIVEINADTGQRKNLKDIENVLPLRLSKPTPCLALIDWFASTYYCSRGLALKTLLPSFPPSILNGKAQRKSNARLTEIHESIVPLTVEHEPLGAPWKDPRVVMVSPSIQEKYALYLTHIQNTLQKKKQCVIFFPTIHDVELFTPYALSRAGITPVRVMHSKKSDGDLFHTWHQALDGEPLCILGTRSAVGIPLDNLDCIIVDQSERMEHCQYDMNPRYDIREVTKKMAELSGAHLLFTSFAPRIDEMSETEKWKYSTLYSKPPSDVLIVNLSDEWRGGGSTGWISEPLNHAIANALDSKRGVFLFHNKKGSGSCLVCRDCGLTYACSSCGEPLQPFSSPLLLKCRPCCTEKTFPQSCDDCHSVKLAVFGLGIEKIATEIRKHFPKNPLFVISADTDNAFLQKFHSKDERNVLNISTAIIIGTSFPVLSCPELFASMGLCAVILGDPSTSVHSFRSEEERWQILAYLRAIACSFSIPLLVQALHPESEFMKNFITGDYQQFANNQLRERERFSWPPYGHCIRLLFRRTKPLPPEALTQRIALVADVLKSRARPDTYRILSQKKILDRFSSHLYEITLHIPHSGTLPESLHTIIESLSDEWLIDRDPLYL